MSGLVAGMGVNEGDKPGYEIAGMKSPLAMKGLIESLGLAIAAHEDAADVNVAADRARPTTVETSQAWHDAESGKLRVCKTITTGGACMWHDGGGAPCDDVIADTDRFTFAGPPAVAPTPEEA